MGWPCSPFPLSPKPVFQAEWNPLFLSISWSKEKKIPFCCFMATAIEAGTVWVSQTPTPALCLQKDRNINRFPLFGPFCMSRWKDTMLCYAIFRLCSDLFPLCRVAASAYTHHNTMKGKISIVVYSPFWYGPFCSSWKAWTGSSDDGRISVWVSLKIHTPFWYLLRFQLFYLLKNFHERRVIHLLLKNSHEKTMQALPCTH